MSLNVVAKNIDSSNVIIVHESGRELPEPGKVTELYAPAGARGGNFVDDPMLRMRVFEFPGLNYRYLFETNRMRIEETGHRTPDESKAAIEVHRAYSKLYNNAPVVAYGFNYDLVYRFDSVIPQREIMSEFLHASDVEAVASFGWQYTLSKDKGRRLETYFFKAVSPIELAVHANFHFQGYPLPNGEALQEDFARCYTNLDEVLRSLAF